MARPGDLGSLSGPLGVLPAALAEVGFIMRCPALSSASCWGLNVESVVMQPMQFSLIVGMRDMLTNFLVVDTVRARARAPCWRRACARVGAGGA